jgi:hypothetical protein
VNRWKRDLLLERIRDLSEAKVRAFTDAGGMFYGAPQRVRDLIGSAINHYEADELQRAERACAAAELAIIEEGHAFAAAQHHA